MPKVILENHDRTQINIMLDDVPEELVEKLVGKVDAVVQSFVTEHWDQEKIKRKDGSIFQSLRDQ